jgi:ADP-ribosylglycohydrolase
MALSIVETLTRNGRIDSDDLVSRFVRRFDPKRGYGYGARLLLEKFRTGADWRIEAPRSFDGNGSYGNGAAMRVAPLGAYFANDLKAVRENAIISAEPTHAHPEGIAGAIAVALAAAIAFRVGEGEAISPGRFLEQVAEGVPDGKTRSGIVAAAAISFSTSPVTVAEKLGSGFEISAQDTVPFCLWCAARHLDHYEEAFWATVNGLGDLDTTCAIVGGITALSSRKRGIPPAWIQAREPLPADIATLFRGHET